MKILGSLCSLALALTIASTSAAAQLPDSNVGQVNLNATLNESLTVSVTSGGTVNFTLGAGSATNAGSTTSTIQTAWVLKSSRTAVAVWAWVASAAGALTDGNGDNIAASQVTATATGSGSAGGALSTTPSGGAAPSFIPANGSGVQIGAVTITAANRASSTTTTLTWNINLTATPQLPAATYTGTVNIEAVTTP